MAGTSSRGNPSMGDVLRSVGVLGLIILALFLVGKLVTATPDDPTSEVDYATAAEGARDALGDAVLAPAKLPTGWRATSARVQGRTWILGVVTDDDEFVGLYQGTKRKDLLEDHAQGTERGHVTIADHRWAETRGTDGEVILVRTVGDTTAVVSGTAPRQQVLDYVASLSSG